MLKYWRTKSQEQAFKSGDNPDKERADVSRRELTGVLGALGLVTLAGCVTGKDAAPDQGTITSALNNTGFIWVDTVVNLYGVKGSGTSYVAIVGGYTTVGDGGGGVFFWDPTSTSGENYGTIIVPCATLPSGVSCPPPPDDTATGRWLRLYSGPLNVRWFGAKGDSVNTDDVNINLAIAAAAPGRTTVFIPRGLYRLNNPIQMLPGVRLIGEGQACTFLEKTGTDASVIVFTSTSKECEVSHLTIRPQVRETDPYIQTSGAAITFSQPTGVCVIKLQDLTIGEGNWPVFRGIAVEGSGFAKGPGTSVTDVTIERVRINASKIGMKLCYAVNWNVSNVIINVPLAAGGSNVVGVLLDTETEGCLFREIFALGGEHCWRITRTINTESDDRGPSENRFYSCIGDNGCISCIYISSLHRGIFTNCWCSTQSVISDAAVVMDSMDIWGVQWVSSQIVFTNGHGIKVLAAINFSITDSTFSEWDLNNLGHSAVIVSPSNKMNFAIIGNRFIRDQDFGAHVNNATITVQSGSYNKYLITNNLSYAGTNASTLGSGSLGAVSDSGTAVVSKIVTNNL